jgi:hypothetical protein
VRERSRNLLAAVSSVLTSVKEWQFSNGFGRVPRS